MNIKKLKRTIKFKLRGHLAPKIRFTLNPTVKKIKNDNIVAYIRKNRKVTAKNDIRNVAIISGPGLGDALIMTPGIKHFKQQYPDVKTNFIVNKNYFPLFKGLKFIDKLIPVDMKKRASGPVEHSVALKEVLEKKKYDLFIFNVHISKKLGQFLHKFKDSIISTANDRSVSYMFAKNKLVNYEVFAQRTDGKPSYIGYSWGIVPFLSVFNKMSLPKPDTVRPLLSKKVISNTSKIVSDIFSKIRKDRTIIYFNPIGRVDKTMPAEQAVTVINNILKKHKNAHVLINRGQNVKIRSFTDKKMVSESDHAQNIADQIKIKNRVQLLPFLNLKELVQTMHGSSMIISVDTATTHISYSDLFSGKPCLNLFTGIKSKIEWTPYPQDNNMFYALLKNKKVDKHDQINAAIPLIMEKVNEIFRKFKFD